MNRETWFFDPLTDRLSELNHWPAVARKQLAERKYADVVQVCRQRLSEDPHLLSGRLLCAQALYKLGQIDNARDQLYAVLSADPDHQAALKLLGDCAFAEGDEMSALAHYERVLDIDPDCRGLACELESLPAERTHTITLLRPEEAATPAAVPLRPIPFYTETMGDLYFAQGYPRLAATVFKVLHERNRHPRLLEKLTRAEEKIKAKE